MHMMEEKEINDLLIKYAEGRCSEEEVAMLEGWYLNVGQQADLEVSTGQIEDATARIWDRLEKSQNRSVYSIWIKIAAAAVVLITLSAGLYFYAIKSDVGETTAQQNKDLEEIAAGKTEATLTLANGRKIRLNDATNGQLAKEAGVTITKTEAGQLVYTILPSAGFSGTESIAYNTIETPKGGQYQVNLPDGTKAWLNAASRLKFPSSFSNLKERRVELSGESYFEVAKNKKMPFRVVSGGQMVEVTGTHFNISSYDDDPILKTTLLEGSVNVNGLHLKPGQQSQLSSQGLQIVAVDAEQEVAWKNGEFIFNGEDLQSIMRKVARWYNVEVVYEVKTGTQHFDGELSRSANLSAVLKTLELTGDVKFKVTGRRVVLIK